MTALSHLRSLQALETAVRLGSLQRAAAALAITPAAVGQRIKALEDYLGIDLILRGRAGLHITPALEGAVEPLRRGFQELELAAQKLNLQRRDQIHVAADRDLAELWLTPRLARFKRDHPHLAFCINGEGDVPYRSDRADCEIYFGPETGAEGSAVLFRDFVLPVTSPANARRIAKMPRRIRLEGFPLLHVDVYRDDPAALRWPTWFETQRLKRTEPARGMRFQRLTPAIAAVDSDAGVLLCGIALLREQIGNRRLALPFARATGAWTRFAFQMRTPRRKMAWPQLRAFQQWVLDEAAATRTWLNRFGARKRH
ncbi:MAG: LysR family transcriptional regulator [Steroidobacteraceae bacterium]